MLVTLNRPQHLALDLAHIRRDALTETTFAVRLRGDTVTFLVSADNPNP